MSVDRSMVGRTCLVTGATSGIGKAIATELARRGATVVIVGRSAASAEESAAVIRRESGSGAVGLLAGDLSVQADVRRVAAQFLERYGRLDVLVNNAGAMFATRRESADGWEMTLALNHLASFLLTNLLLERLKASAPARIVIVSSGAHKDARRGFPFGDPQASGGWYKRSPAWSVAYTLLMPWAHPAFRRYAQTKLANLLFMRELSTRLAGTGVTVNALHPGLVKTQISSNNGVFGRFMGMFLGITGISPEQGARTAVYLACAPEVEGVTGGYFELERPATPSRAAMDPDAPRRLWRLSEEWTGLAAAGGGAPGA